MCVPFDASALLWKVKDKYDLNLTVFCTFLHKGGCFIALKRIILYGLGSLVFYKPLSKLVTAIYFSLPEVGTNES